MSKHRHHIIPKHAGGTDDPSNIIELTVKEHAEAHLWRWLKYGQWQDKIAWKALLGRIGKEEIIRQVQYNAVTGPRKKRGPLSKEHKQKIRVSKEGEKNPMFGKPAWNSKTPATNKQKEVISIAIKNKTKTCPYCNKTVHFRIYGRWHGDKCKNKQQ
jgi:hypothetical protein